MSAPRSAQAATIYCIIFEEKFYSLPWEDIVKAMALYFHAHTIPTRPYRFRDNIVGVVHGAATLTAIVRCFEHLYDLTLQVEGEGGTLPSLESELSIIP